MSSVKSYTLHANNASVPESMGLPTGATFGILRMRMAEKPRIETPVFIQFTLDKSISMAGPNIEHLIRTVNNIMRVIAECNMPITVKIDAFNDRYTRIVPPTLVTKENLTELMEKISNISAYESTNIEEALTESQRDLESTAYHFFLTDGVPTLGSVITETLVNLVRPDITAVFIGYGECHNAELLSKFANRNPGKSSYQLVTQVETIGDLCGELLNEICYPALKDVVITTSGPDEYIFDPTTNEWSHKISMSQLISAKEYKFYLYSMNGEFVDPCLSGVDPTSGNIEIIEFFKGAITDLSEHIFQFRTNRLLLDAIAKKAGTYEALGDLFRTIHRYARENELLENPTYKVMLDDIYLTHLKYHTTTGFMYATARQVSNRRQQNYRASSATRQLECSFSLRRTPSTQIYDYDEVFDVCDIDEQTVPFDDAGLSTQPADEIDTDDITNYTLNTATIDYSTTQTMNELRRRVSS